VEPTGGPQVSNYQFAFKLCNHLNDILLYLAQPLTQFIFVIIAQRPTNDPLNVWPAMCIQRGLHGGGFMNTMRFWVGRAFAGACLWICGPKRGRCKAPRTG